MEWVVFGRGNGKGSGASVETVDSTVVIALLTSSTTGAVGNSNPSDEGSEEKLSRAMRLGISFVETGLLSSFTSPPSDRVGDKAEEDGGATPAELISTSSNSASKVSISRAW